MLQSDPPHNERGLRVAESVALAARISVLLLFILGAVASQRALATVEHAQAVTQTVESVRLQQLDIRLHSRGYMLSGDSIELRDLAVALRKRDSAFARLVQLTGHSPEARKGIAALRATLDSGDVIGARTRGGRRSGSAEANSSALQASGLLPVSDSTESQLDALLASEQATLFAETARQHRAIDVTLAAAVTGAIIAALIGLTTLRYRRRHTTDIAERAASFRRLSDDSPDGVLVHIGYTLVYANPALEALLHTDGLALVGRRIRDLVHPDDREEIDRRTAHVSQVGTPTAPRVIRFLRDDGGVCEAEARGAPITFGGMPAIQVVLRDLTARRDAERALSQSEVRFRAVLDAMDEGVVLHDADMSIRLSNPAAQRILGLSEAQLTGRTPSHPAWRTIDADGADFPPERHYAVVAMRNARPASGVMGVELPTRDRVWINVNAVPLFREGQTEPVGVVATFADITARRTLEEQLRQAQKMEVMGRMASGVAHDFNNLLTIVRSASELLRLDARRAGVTFETLDDIESATDRAVALTNHLLTFSRRQQAAPALLRPDVLVLEALPILRRLAGDGVSVKHHADDAGAPLWISADPVRFEQVLVNLVSNAKDAMPTGGTVRLRTQAITLHERVSHRFGVINAGRYVTLSVEDSGTGMTGDVLDHLFDPFYTTKKQGRGTGLGLSIVYGVVHEALGTITVQSEPGEGSRLTVYWPRAEAPLTPMPARPDDVVAPLALTHIRRPPEQPPEPHRGELVLLVDDQENVRRVVAKQLEASGFAVITAESGPSALALLRNVAFDIRVVVSDVRMPEMSGIELVSAMLAEKIDCPVLLISGQMDTQLPREWPTGATVRFLPKPLSGAALRRTVSELLALNARAENHPRS